jgi:hypothetical protein
VPIRNGQYDSQAQVWRTDSLVPQNVTYSAKFYDDSNRLVSSQESSRLVNGGFESGAQSWNVIGGSTIAASEESARSGQQCLVLTNVADSIIINESPVETVEGEVVYAEIYCLSESANGQARIVLAFYDAANTLITFSQTFQDPTAEYTKLSVSAIAPAGTAYTKFQTGGYLSTTGVWRFDDGLLIKTKRKIISESVVLKPASLTVPSVVLS